MIRAKNNSGPRGIYILSTFRPYDLSANEVASIYSGALVLGDGYSILDAGWMGPSGDSSGPVRAALRYSFQGSTVGQDPQGQDVGQGHLNLFAIGTYMAHSENNDFLPGFLGQRYFYLPDIGKCFNLSMTIWTPLNMYDRRATPKTSGVSRNFAQGWPIERLSTEAGLVDPSISPGSSPFEGGDPIVTEYFIRDEAAIAVGEAGEFPTHGVEYLPGEFTL